MKLWFFGKSREEGENKRKLVQEGQSGSYVGGRVGDIGRGGEGEDDIVFYSWDMEGYQCFWMVGLRIEYSWKVGFEFDCINELVIWWIWLGDQNVYSGWRF